MLSAEAEPSLKGRCRGERGSRLTAEFQLEEEWKCSPCLCRLQPCCQAVPVLLALVEWAALCWKLSSSLDTGQRASAAGPVLEFCLASKQKPLLMGVIGYRGEKPHSPAKFLSCEAMPFLVPQCPYFFTKEAAGFNPVVYINTVSSFS